ncbi:MAG: hypothetical protein NC099_02745 [Corallococcus sp.]|nr:hypothetical protein [Bacillota bacterium]MCM1533550.1 hypothetical protein [Corallococcus sp.]
MTKKQVVKTSIFALILVAIVLCMSLIKVRNYSVDEFYSQDENTIDVLTIGPSTVQRGYVPGIAWGEYGYTAYNWGQTLIHIESVKIMLDEFVKTQNPKLVFIDIYPLSYRSYDTYTNRLQWFIERMPEGESRDFYAEKYSDICTLSEPVVNLWEKHNVWRDVAVLEKSENFNGFLPGKKDKTLVIKQKEIMQKKDANADGVRPLSDYNRNNIVEILDKCKEINSAYGTEFLFGIMPRFYLYDGKDTDGDIINGVATLEKYCMPLIVEAGFDYINFCDEDSLDLNPETDMYDRDHLNKAGALKFTRYFSEYIKKEYGVYRPTHGDSTTAQYDKLYLHSKHYFGLD